MPKQLKSRNKKHFSRKRIYKKNVQKSKRKIKESKRKTKKMRGGIAFNDTARLGELTFKHVPLNTYDDQIRDGINSRLIPMHGGRKTRKNSKKNGKMKGGNIMATDVTTGISTPISNDVLAFGTTGGTEYMYGKLMGEPVNTGSEIQPENIKTTLV